MNLTKLSIQARRFHRLTVWAIVTLGLVMMATGMTLKYPSLSPLDPGLASRIHNLTSTFFAIALFFMMLTGLYMYLYPSFQKWAKKASTPQV